MSGKPDRDQPHRFSGFAQSKHDFRTGNPSINPDPIIKDSLNERAMTSFASSLPQSFYLKHPLNPLLSPLSFIYHIFRPTGTFHWGRESHLLVTRRGQRPHRKLWIPAGVSPALENCQTQWTERWRPSTKAELKINPACKATAEDFIMLMQSEWLGVMVGPWLHMS